MLPGAPLGNNSGWTTSTPLWLQNQPQNRLLVGVPTFSAPLVPVMSRPDMTRFTTSTLPMTMAPTPFSLPSTSPNINPFTGSGSISPANMTTQFPLTIPFNSPAGVPLAPSGIRQDAWTPPVRPDDPYGPAPDALPEAFTTTPAPFRPQPSLSATPWEHPAAERPWPPASPPDDERNRFNEPASPDWPPSGDEMPPARPSRPARPERPPVDEATNNGLEGSLGPENDEAAQIANEVQKLVYDGLQANPELVYKLQQLGIVDKLKNREEAALELRAKAQDVLDLIPDRFENRFQNAIGNRLGPTYQPLFDEAMDWIRKPLSPQEARRTGHETKKSWMVRLWNWLWGDRHIPFLGGKKHRKQEEDLYF